MDSSARELVKIGDDLFSRKATLDTLRQSIAELYYPQRADFTVTSTLGDDPTDGLMTSYPVLARQELGNLLGPMLRQGNWLSIHAAEKKIDEQHEARVWLEWATGVQFKAMYDKDAALRRATREADHDFVTFGDAVLSVEVDLARVHLLYRNWHPRDCAWTENASGQVDSMHRKWKPTARQLKQKFKDISSKVEKACKDEPNREIECRHIVVPRDDYGYRDGKAPRADWMSLYVDVENEHVMEATPMGWFMYVPPRFMTISGSQYGYSPCVVMPDARSANVLWRVLMEAGEKAVDPPMFAASEVFRSDFNVYAGGLTWADIEHDQRLSDYFATLPIDKSGLPFGTDLATEIKNSIAGSFFLNKIVLPTDTGAKTAYEVRQLVLQQLRASAPLFEPMEEDYSAPLCETTFEALRTTGVFGRPEDMPQVLRGRDIEFQFENPMRTMERESKSQAFVEGMGLVGNAVQIDPSLVAHVNKDKALRDALKGLGWPEDWLGSEEDVMAARERIEAQARMQMGGQALGAAAGVAKTAGEAGKALQEAGMV